MFSFRISFSRVSTRESSHTKEFQRSWQMRLDDVSFDFRLMKRKMFSLCVGAKDAGELMKETLLPKRRRPQHINKHRLKHRIFTHFHSYLTHFCLIQRNSFVSP